MTSIALLVDRVRGFGFYSRVSINTWILGRICFGTGWIIRRQRRAGARRHDTGMEIAIDYHTSTTWRSGCQTLGTLGRYGHGLRQMPIGG